MVNSVDFSSTPGRPVDLRKKVTTLIPRQAALSLSPERVQAVQALISRQAVLSLIPGGVQAVQSLITRQAVELVTPLLC